MRKTTCFVSLLFFIAVVHAQIKSPEEFLGYKIGTKYTPYWKIIDYFQYVAANVPKMVKMEQYGETNEGRPLVVAFVSDPANMQQLESIRLNNLRLANMVKDNTAVAEEGSPAIVWLSYNVHGNETSSSEAALLTLFSLVDPGNAQAKEWLKNTVVVIDPCINPDGRDRYVNWFNSIAGTSYNPSTDAREHREPWPGGRTNHYNFDLNRDWAWQTQKESRQRLKLYNQWLPQVHVDYHEQGINAPYYFAPAAQPYHEVITPWQREFQVSIGKNNAKYFDGNGWLFFTKQVFDLFYPSYGDTYPIYNGAIGMTYEQGGGPAGGLGVLKEEGDTLTLVDRVMHHYTTGLSTIEMTSRNAAKLVKEFHQFFNEALRNGTGEYKTYIIKNSSKDAERINALLDLLDRNNIQYGAASGNGKGLNYSTGREEPFSISPGDIAISAYQPKSTLVKVLFEPKSKLVDSATYDITAWALPYVFGLDCFASKEKIAVGGNALQTFSNNMATDVYGYAIKWEGVSAARTAGQLLQKGVRLRFAREPFTVDGQQFDRGTLLVLKTSNEAFANNLWNVAAEACNSNHVKLYPVTTGFVEKGDDFGSDQVRVLKAPRIALLTGEGTNSNAAGEVWFFIEQQLRYPVTLINMSDFGRANWDKYDVIILPDGNYRFLNDKEMSEQLKDWVSHGGRIVALESAVNQLSKLDWVAIKLKKDEDSSGQKNEYSALRKFADRDRDQLVNSIPGAIFKIDLDNTNPLAFGYPSWYYTLKMDDNVYAFMKDGWNVGVVKKTDAVSGFIGSKLKRKLKDATIFGMQELGSGAVIFLTDDILFRNFWENGKLMFCNALFFAGR
jgi:hypothetical protein